MRHEVILKLKKDCDDQEIDHRLARVRKLAAGIPLVQKTSTGRSLSREYRVAVVAMEVKDETDLFRLQIHHVHATIVGLLQTIADDISVTDVRFD